MHTFQALSRLQVAPWAERCADSTPLVTVVTTGRAGLLSVLQNSRLICNHSYKREATAQAEGKAGFVPPVYFFAGRAYPAPVGAAALLAPAGHESSYSAEATPFDTGGVVHGHTLLPWSAIDPHTKEGYIETHTMGGADFRTYFARHLSAHFVTSAVYWEGVPSVPIDGVDFNTIKSCDWRDWTFEVRYYQDVPIAGLRVYLSKDANDFIAAQEDTGLGLLTPDQSTIDPDPAGKAESDAKSAGVIV